MRKICFVIMGFGKKTDPYTGRTLDLDRTYLDIINPAVKIADLECVRADEITDSGAIDKSMYALLMHADLVIADISTWNPNAIYELGIRHAVRPYSTIIIKDQQGKIPFDLDHNRIFHYDHMGDQISPKEIERCKNELVRRITEVLESSVPDSPLYEHIRGITAPTLPEDELKDLVKRLAIDEKRIYSLSQAALVLMANENFIEAEQIWGKLTTIAENESYFVQQQALCRYKSKHPSSKLALHDALMIINKLSPETGDTTDPETLGITGAIYKNLFREDGDVEYLNRAIAYYQKGYIVRSDYYNGENYAHCNELKASSSENEEERIFLKFEAKAIRNRVINSILTTIKQSDEKRVDQKWLYASLSNCYLAIGDNEASAKYESDFLSENPESWEVKTFEKSKSEIIKYE